MVTLMRPSMFPSTGPIVANAYAKLFAHSKLSKFTNTSIGATALLIAAEIEFDLQFESNVESDLLVQPNNSDEFAAIRIANKSFFTDYPFITE